MSDDATPIIPDPVPPTPIEVFVSQPARTLQRLNQAMIDLTGDTWFGANGFALMNGGPMVVVHDPVRFAEALEQLVERMPPPSAPTPGPGQTSLDV